MTRVLAFLKEALLLELALYRSLARWVARHPDVPAGAVAIGYSRLVVPVMWLWIFASGAEVVVVEVVLRTVDAGWAHGLRLPLLVIGVWGLLWMVGLLASYRVHPHLLLPDRVRIRVGARTWAEVRYDALVAVRPVEHALPGTIRATHRDGDLFLIGVSGRTNLELVLEPGTTIATSKGPQRVDRVGFWVDEPRATARELQVVRVP